MDDQLRARLANQMARGEVILFTGAGFASLVRNTAGHPLPSVEELRQHLWPIAFPGEPTDMASTVEDVFDCAVTALRTETQRLMKRTMMVDMNSVPDVYGLWFGMPWHRIYTVTIDDLDDVVNGRFPLARPVRTISALRDQLPAAGTDLWSVHLQGRLEDFPEVAVSQRPYAEGSTRVDAWHRLLVAELSSHPVLFVGEDIDALPLWQHLEMRRGRGRQGRELRPGSYLVAPSLSLARRRILSDYNVDWVQMHHTDFARAILANLGAAQRAGLEAITGRTAGRTATLLYPVGQLRRQHPSGDEANFLLGRQPTWPDLTAGYAVERRFESGFKGAIDQSDSQIVILTGTAGSGQSTTLMRLCLRYHDDGRDVRWLNLNTNLSVSEIRREIAANPPDVVAVDDADVFGEMTGPLLANLATDNPKLRVLASVRASRYDRLDIEGALANVRFMQYTVPLLADEDIDLLLDTLSNENRLGQLRGKSREEQVGLFRSHCGRQLLVAMIEATSGEKFDEKIENECKQLAPESGALYAVVTVATTFRYPVARDEILVAVGDHSNETLNRIQSLVNQHLLITTEGGLLLRHRVIAERALDYYRSEGQLRDAVRGLAFAMATRVQPNGQRQSRAFRLLVRLINHDWLLRMMTRLAARSVYQEIENLLEWDYHYWLQRGSLEVEDGDIRLAQHFLAQARSLAPNDHRVQTEWAYMNLKRACLSPDEADSSIRVEEALSELDAAIAGRGRSDSYPYHVFGSQGLAWVHRTRQSSDEKIRLLGRLRSVVQEGVRNHPRNQELVQLAQDLTREYLMMAVPRGV